MQSGESDGEGGLGGRNGWCLLPASSPWMLGRLAYRGARKKNRKRDWAKLSRGLSLICDVLKGFQLRPMGCSLVARVIARRQDFWKQQPNQRCRASAAASVSHQIHLIPMRNLPGSGEGLAWIDLYNTHLLSCKYHLSCLDTAPQRGQSQDPLRMIG
jgi:hypothetical protein